jgi:hypothetical protein
MADKNTIKELRGELHEQKIESSSVMGSIAGKLGAKMDEVH